MEPKQNKPKLATKGTWGGRRPGAGAPKGNLNALKHGRYSRYQQALIEALMQVPETRAIMIKISKRQRAQTRRAEQGGAALLAELTRRVGQIALSGDDHLEDIQEFLASLRTAEAELEKILEKHSSATAKKRNTIKRAPPQAVPPLPGVDGRGAGAAGEGARG